MRKDRRLYAGLVGVAAVVTWLIWTGISDTMVYYLTPTELMARVDGDAALQERGVRVSGSVVQGSYASFSDELLHTFEVYDPAAPEVILTVHFRHPSPDTFSDSGDVEVVMEGRYKGDGIFEATEVLTKCGSRYEAMPEESDYVTDAYAGDKPVLEGAYSSDYGGEGGT